MNIRSLPFLGFIVLVGGCSSGAVAPVVQGGIKQNWLGQTPTAQHFPDAHAEGQIQKSQPITQSVTQDTIEPIIQPKGQMVAPLLKEEQLAQITPAAGPVFSATHEAVNASTQSEISYQVAPQDTLFRIARAHNTTPQAIMNANNLRDIADIQVGRVLVIPANTRSTAPSLAQSIQAYLTTPPSRAPSAQMANASQEKPVALIPAPPAKTYKQPLEIAKIEPAAGSAPNLNEESGVGLSSFRHQVAAGETIYRISKAYGVSVFDIMAANDLAKPEALQAGILVNIPASTTMVKLKKLDAIPQNNKIELRPTTELGVTETTRATIATNVNTSTEKNTTRDFDPDKGTDSAASVQPLKAIKPITDTERMKAELKRGTVDSVAAAQSGLIWPARGQVVKRFGEKGQGVAYTGINIQVPLGTPVLATEAGTVLYANDGLRMYGQMVLIRHNNGMVAAYAHNSHLLVRKGEKVKKGQVIAMSGQSGNTASPQLHFELRRNAVALDPLQVLPKL